MSIPEFNVREEYIGDGTVLEYSFDFKIAELTDLQILQTDAAKVEVFNVFGDDTTFIDSVEFDPDNGGGSVFLKANLPATYNLALIQSDDNPTQPSEFKNKSDFTLNLFERALDVLGRGIQRLAYLCKRSIRLPDNMLDADVEAFDTKLPLPVADQALGINSTANGFKYIDIQALVDAAVAAAFAAYNFCKLFGSIGGPLAIDPLIGIVAPTDMDPVFFEQRLFLVGLNPGENVVSANPQIQAHTKIGARMYVEGVAGTDYLTFNDGNGLKLNGPWSSIITDPVSGLTYPNSLSLSYDGAAWAEDSRKA